MDRNSIYFKQVQLLIRLLPLVAAENDYALKGGTAINLFVRDMPRLSVDIDLVYLPMDNRETALKNSRAALARIGATVKDRLKGIRIQKTGEETDSLRLIVEQVGQQDRASVKIELSPVLRGVVFPSEVMPVKPRVEETFGFAETQVVSLPDLYAGKICAALDRQHPRDLYDVKLLLENEGLTKEIRKAFLVYLISHSRPIAELLNPNRQEIAAVFKTNFEGMTQEPVKIQELEEAREKLIGGIMKGLTEPEKKFLLSFKARKPDWSLLDLAGVDQLPAVRWKMQNLEKLPGEKHKQLLDGLEQVLSGQTGANTSRKTRKNGKSPHSS